MTLRLLLCLCFSSLLCAQDAEPDSPLDFSVLDAEGNEVALSSYQGTVLLIVNVASRCGLVGQYAGLQELQQTYGEQGFSVLAFPANDFMGQEPGSDAEIQEFCSTRYGVTFPVFAKLSVKGDAQHPLYHFLTEETAEGLRGAIRWNFDKFLVSEEGLVIGRFAPKTKPTAEEVTQAIEAALAAE